MESDSERISLDQRPNLVENHHQQGEIVIPVAGEAGAPLQDGRSPCLDGVTHGGDTALHIAARFGQLEEAGRICSENVSLLMRENVKFETPLHYAAKAGKHELVAFFIKLCSAEASNIDLDELSRKRNRDGETAFYQAVLYNHLAVVEKFMAANDNPSISQLASIPNNKNISPLYLAIMQDQLSIVTCLIGLFTENVSRGAYAGPDGQTALHAAALRSKGIVQMVLDWRQQLAKSTDKSGSTPLHYAASAGNVETVQVMLENDRLCAYVADSSGLYPVHVAVAMGFVDVVAELFNLCPDLDKLLDKTGRNFVHLAVEEQDEPIVQWICSKTELAEAMNAQDDNGDTAMHLAVKASHINIFARLLGSKMAHLHVTNKEGLTPRDLAISIHISKMTFGFAHWQNPGPMMIRTMGLIGCCRGINRADHLASELQLQVPQEEEKLVKSFDSMAKSMAIGTVLIASAAFAATFSVSGAYKADVLAGDQTPGLRLAFKSFILMIAYAFVCSIIATCLLIEAALTILDPIFRRDYIMLSTTLIKMSTKGFVVAFAIRAYVELTPVSKWLAFLICLTGAVMPALIQPYMCPNLLVIRALIEYLGWRGFFLGCLSAFWGNILFGIFVLLVLVGSLVPSRGAFPDVLVLAYGTAIILVSVFRFIPIGYRVFLKSHNCFKT